MPSGTLRSLVVPIVLVSAVCTAACGGVFEQDYEYEEEMWLATDGSATVRVNASVASLVALRGADLDVSPRARPDREGVRRLFSASGVTVGTPTFSRRNGRRFVHVRVDVPDVRQLTRLAPLAWSSYRLDRRDDGLTFRQVVGKPSGRPVHGVGWTGQEFVAFRVHVPSRVLFENASTDVQRGNILVWEQPLSERLSGMPVDLQVEMQAESILRATLVLFGLTIVAAAATFALAVWWIAHRGREPATTVPGPSVPPPPSSTRRSPQTHRTISQSTAPEAARPDR